MDCEGAFNLEKRGQKDRRHMTKKEWIYDMMNGFLVGDALMLPKEEIFIIDEFKEGMYCYKQYEQVLNAKFRLEDRLGVDEDSDVDAIIDCMNDIMKYLAMKMYDYGKLSAANDNTSNRKMEEQ